MGIVFALRFPGETPPGNDVPVTPLVTDQNGAPVPNPPAVAMTFDQVLNAGTTTVTVTDTAPPLPPEFTAGQPALFLDIETTATFTGTVEVIVSYANISFAGDPANLRLIHFENGAWRDITVSNNTTTKVIVGQAVSFSPFAVVLSTQRNPVQMIDDLIAVVRGVHASHGTITSLTTKLRAAQSALTDERPKNNRKAADKLLDFVDQAREQRGKQLLAADADSLVRDAEAILATL